MPKNTTSTTASTPVFAIRAFKDAGTGRSFEKDAVVDVEAGEIANYAAAGLVTETKPEATAAEAA